MPTTQMAARSIMALHESAQAIRKPYEFLLLHWVAFDRRLHDLQSTLTPQDSYFPGLERSTSLFDQRHRSSSSAAFIRLVKLSGAGSCEPAL